LFKFSFACVVKIIAVKLCPLIHGIFTEQNVPKMEIQELINMMHYKYAAEVERIRTIFQEEENINPYPLASFRKN
jgi:hypothetical protein